MEPDVYSQMFRAQGYGDTEKEALIQPFPPTPGRNIYREGLKHNGKMHAFHAKRSVSLASLNRA